MCDILEDEQEQAEDEQNRSCSDQKDAWMTVDDAVAYTRIKRGTLYRLMKEDILPWYRVTGTKQRRIKRSDLDRLMVPGEPDDDSPDGEKNT